MPNPVEKLLLGRAPAKMAPGRGPGRGKKGAAGRQLLLKRLGLAHQGVTELERANFPMPEN
jgi:hypothetical protein